MFVRLDNTNKRDRSLVSTPISFLLVPVKEDMFVVYYLLMVATRLQQCCNHLFSSSRRRVSRAVEGGGGGARGRREDGEDSVMGRGETKSSKLHAEQV
jgi:hypothetical protein